MYSDEEKENKVLKECAYTKKKHHDLEERYKKLVERSKIPPVFASKVRHETAGKGEEVPPELGGTTESEERDCGSPCGSAEPVLEIRGEEPGLGLVYAVPYENVSAEKKEHKTDWRKNLGGVFLAILVLAAGVFLVHMMWPQTLDKLSSLLLNPQLQQTGGEAGEAEMPREEIRRIAAEDKTSLIEEIRGDYGNLQNIVYNPELKYQEGTAYRIADLEKSQPLTDNIWYEMGGEPVYYDESALRTIAQFNNRWIDYINTGDRSVFEMINLEGKAAKDAPGFYAEDLKETFSRLEIGEIRRLGDKLYVWTHEEILAERDGKTELREYNWIYTILVGEENPIIEGYSVDGYYKY